MLPPREPEIWITGAAAITALGADLDATWQAVLAGRTAGQWLTLRTPTGATIFVPGAPAGARFLSGVPLEASAIRADRLARAVTRQAVGSAALGTSDHCDVALAFGTSKPLLDDYRSLDGSCAAGPRLRLATLDPARRVAAELGLAGPILSSVAACSTGLHGLIRAVQWLQDGRGELAIAGAVESSLHPLFAGAFLRMGVLATSDPPSAACRPFDRERQGFILAEAAGALVLETAEHARRRGATALAVIAGYALGTDPTGLAEPGPAGRPLAGTIRRCLSAAAITPTDVACIKAHGTGTRLNDASEAAAIRDVFCQACPPVISLKGHIGHTLGASGAVEAAILMKGIAADLCPPTANLRRPDPACGLNHPMMLSPILRGDARHILGLSAGFGGHLAALLLRPARFG